ncbi:hypothetical protein PTSG_02482 [Salpingoeca rosetta]|uniref:COMM domain-containing protein n=1 Tax=Salpingoeca rosetta (strain ATCC 50818 / BSB-021) TaxID=946362 RepID=F2U2B7_SALR5|nr:uncharacterized protein PTSG_02482 [Salpingoeca rosetta]EGD81769.1 hypothetical protein PTSG_02482 [Salpingoeca rosetta]|eukprot:XP_004996973.1 hypothetical protein PTSG_02482 [Salpingoeca rosetta]
MSTSEKSEVLASDNLPDQVFADLVEVVVEILTSTSTTDELVTKVKEFAQSHEDASARVINASFRGWLTFFRNAQRTGMSVKAIFEELMRIGFSKGKAQYVAKKFKANEQALTRTLIGNTFAINEIVDMQWKFGVTAGSSEFKQTGDSFLQLKLILQRGTTREEAYMELSLPQFYAFLKEMETAKSCLESLS